MFLAARVVFALHPACGSGGTRRRGLIGEHLVAAQVAELFPTQVLLVKVGVFVSPEVDAGKRLMFCMLAFPLLLLGAFALRSEQAREHEERDLFDHGQRVGDAAGPELFPELVDSCCVVGR